MNSVIYGVKEGDGWAWEIRPNYARGQYLASDINAAHTYCQYLKNYYHKRPEDIHFHVEEHS